MFFFFFFSSRRRHTRSLCDWSSDVCSSDLELVAVRPPQALERRPGLARGRDELPLVDADRTGAGRRLGGRILRAAGGADEGRHEGRITHPALRYATAGTTKRVCRTMPFHALILGRPGSSLRYGRDDLRFM